MTPYASLLYFGLSLYAAVPVVLSGLIQRLKLARVWIVAVTALMVWLQYRDARHVWLGAMLSESVWVLGFAFAHYLLARVWLVIRRHTDHRGPFWLVISLALAPLAATRFAPLFALLLALCAPCASFVSSASLDAIGFLGISYLTFRSLDVLISVGDGLITKLPPGQYLAFLLFFPTLSSGPVDRYQRFAGDWSRDRSRAEVLDDLDIAVRLLFRGLLYKFILAALIKQHWLDPTSHASTWPGTLAYMYAYSFYLFFDFAGYSAFAVSLSHVFGIHTPENFLRPFAARNIRDFWNRWHISLSTWFRDHVYMRFVMAATQRRWFKQRQMASYVGFAVSMGLMGLWHGTALHYLLYGAYHAMLLIGHDVFSRWNKQHKLLTGRLGSAASIALTFNAVCFGLLIFSGRLIS